MLLVSFLLLFVTYSSAQGINAYNCNWTNSATGDMYSFYPLLNNNTDYFLATTSWKVWMNVCRQTVTSLCGINVAACQQWDPNTPSGKASLGLSSSASFGPLARTTQNGQKGSTLKFTGGVSGRAFELDFQCSTATGAGNPTFEVETPSKFYNFQWITTYACPTNRPPPGPPGSGGLSGGGIFLILVFCLLAVYVAAGITYNVVMKKATGKEIIPNVEFWLSIPGLTKDGVMFIVNSTCRRGSGYAQVH